ncbi:MAG: DNA-protecting protein DprA [Verrucomicrobiales bacterium]|nr:DNA-protecting protein DprA [Verrucomicrobiales bacterium]
MNPREALLALNLLPEVGPVGMRRLLERFGDAPAVLAAPARALMEVDRIGPKVAGLITRWENHVDLAGELERIRNFDCTLLTQEDDLYPPLLREIYDPPIILYVRGKLEERDRYAIAMVGTRQSTLYGREACGRLAGQLAASGITVVSGGARGIDTAAHEAALRAGGRTITVLGTGLDIVYPAENIKLFQGIAESGAVITQFPFGRRGDKQSFPIRNRIVAGMTQGTVVVEANRSSGALITANFAAEYGRTVYAVPGRIDSPRSAGCHGLIKDGAQLCESAEDVLAEFANHNYSSNEQPELPLPSLTPAEQTIYNVLTHEEMQQDAIIRRSELPPAQVSVALLQLEMKKLIQQHPGRLFTRVR